MTPKVNTNEQRLNITNHTIILQIYNFVIVRVNWTSAKSTIWSLSLSQPKGSSENINASYMYNNICAIFSSSLFSQQQMLDMRMVVVFTLCMSCLRDNHDYLYLRICGQWKWNCLDAMLYVMLVGWRWRLLQWSSMRRVVEKFCCISAWSLRRFSTLTLWHIYGRNAIAICGNQRINI